MRLDVKVAGDDSISDLVRPKEGGTGLSADGATCVVGEGGSNGEVGGVVLWLSNRDGPFGSRGHCQPGLFVVVDVALRALKDAGCGNPGAFAFAKGSCERNVGSPE